MVYAECGQDLVKSRAGLSSLAYMEEYPLTIHAYRDVAHLDATKSLRAAAQEDRWVVHPHCTIDRDTFRLGVTTIQSDLGEVCAMQAAMVLYLQSKELSALRHFFPIIGWLDGPGRARWANLYTTYFVDSPLRIEFIDRARRPAPLAVRSMVVGQLVSCFVYRPDVLAAFRATQPTFSICADNRTYTRVGGVGGGCYDETAHQLILEVSRLFEGYWQPNPGVSPFLHELGHMLDGAQRRLSHGHACVGELPAMDDVQRLAWQSGKRVEVQHYRRYQEAGRVIDSAPLGHPYVFQTDGEFLAGSWEMFWRNPHAFAEHSPVLYAGLVSYVGHDPRVYTTDYSGYVTGNRAFYAGGERAWPSQIRIS